MSSPSWWARAGRPIPPLDGQHPVLEIVKAQRHKLATASTRVRGQANEQADLLGLVQSLNGSPHGGDELVGRSEQAKDLLGAEVQPGPGPCGTAHAGERIDVDDPFHVGPSDGRAQHAEAARDDGDSGSP